LGHVYVDAKLRGLQREVDLKRILVDTGASFTVIGRDILKDAGSMETPWTMDLMLSNKTRVKASIHMAEIEIEGRKGPMRIATFDNAVPVIGFDTLETLGLRVNPTTAKLEEVRGEFLLYIVNIRKTSLQ